MSRPARYLGVTRGGRADSYHDPRARGFLGGTRSPSGALETDARCLEPERAGRRLTVRPPGKTCPGWLQRPGAFRESVAALAQQLPF